MPKSTIGFCLILMGTIASIPLQAGEILHNYIDDVDGHYIISLDMRITADPKKVYAILADFNNLSRINDNVIKSTLLHSHKRKHRLRLESRACVLFYCKQIVQVQDVEEFDDGYISMVIDPKLSDFKSGHILWHIQPIEGGTRVTFSVDLVPDFWIPPLIGPWLLKGIMKEEGLETLMQLERQAGSLK